MRSLRCTGVLTGLLAIVLAGAAASAGAAGSPTAARPSSEATSPSSDAAASSSDAAASSSGAAATSDEAAGASGAASESQRRAASAVGPAELDVANRRILTFRATVGTVTPSVRVADAKSRIGRLTNDDLDHPVVAKPTRHLGQRGYAIEINGKYLLGILQEDLDPIAGERLDVVAASAVKELEAARQAYLELREGGQVVRQLGRIAVAILVFAVAWIVLARLYRRASAVLAAATERRIARLAARGLDVTALATRGALMALAAAYWALVAFGAYACLTYGLAAFVYTRPWGDRMAQWVIDLLLDFLKGTAAAIPGLFTVVLIFLVARALQRTVDALLARVERGEAQISGLHPETAHATRSIANVLIWLFALTIAYPYLPGSESEIFKGVSLFAGLMVSLGATGIISQWISGMNLVYSRALHVGDLVKAGEVEGVVTFVGLLSTKVRTDNGDDVTIPNTIILSGAVRNSSRLGDGSGSRISTTVTIGYDAPWRQVHAMLLEAARRTQGLRSDPPPYVLQRALNDFYVEYELVVRVDSPMERAHMMTRLHGTVQDVFNEYGVQIMSPHFVLQPAQPVVIDRSQWYAAPAARDEARPMRE